MAGQIIFEEGDAPASPAASNLALYAKANNILYTKDSSGTETEVNTTTAAATAQRLFNRIYLGGF